MGYRYNGQKLVNGDDSKEQKLQGLTSVGIRDSAHQPSRGAE